MSKKQSKNKENDNNGFKLSFHRISNLKKGLKICISNYIAPSVIELGIALCSCFIDSSIFYVNLEFCVGQGTTFDKISLLLTFC